MGKDRGLVGSGLTPLVPSREAVGVDATPSRVQLSRAKGWRMPPDTVKVDRTTPWGNPWRIGEPYVSGASDAVRMFQARLDGPLAPSVAPDSYFGRLRAHIHELQGKNLACWCRLCPEHKAGKPFWVRCEACAPCHSDPLGRLANPNPTREPEQ